MKELFLELAKKYIAVHNLGWMSWNIILAFAGLYFAWLLTKKYRLKYKILIGFGWLLFVPNSIYISTDIYHLMQQWPWAHAWEKPILILQYIILIPLGFTIYYFSLKYFDIFLKKDLKIKQKYHSVILITFNFLISYGVFLGRLQRANSWHILSQPLKLLVDALEILTEPQYILLIIAFGLGCNLFYFALRKNILGAKYQVQTK